MSDLIERQRSHWRKIHTTRMTLRELEQWIDEIPGYEDLECNCQKCFYKIVEEYPPRFDDWDRWTFDVHNAVNRHLSKPELPWPEACAQWGWTEGS